MNRLIALLQCQLFYGFIHTSRVNIIIITRDDPRFGLVSTGPAYDLAIDNARIAYPEVFRNVSVHSVHYRVGRYMGCPEAGEDMGLIAARNVGMQTLRQLEGFSVMVTPGCSPEVLVLGDFAREWDIPLLASSASDNKITNKSRYPTVTAYGPVDMTSFTTASKKLLFQHSWKTVFLLFDNMTQSPSVGTVYSLLFNNLRSQLEQQKHIYTVSVLTFDSKYLLNNTTEILLRPRDEARIIFIFTKPAILRDILIAAYMLGMANGDYVFIAPMSTKQPTLGDLYWQNNDSSDEMAFIAFQSTIIMAHPTPNWEEFESVFETIAAISQTKYNKTLTMDEWYNDVVVCAYELMETVAMLINEVYPFIGNVTGRSFSQRAWNRTWDLDLQSVYIDQNGMRKGNVRLTRINTSSGLFEETWFYSARNNTLTVSSSALADTWYNRTSFPPDVPRCGFRHERCLEQQSLIILLCAIIAPLVACLILFLAFFCQWRRMKRREEYSMWWNLDPYRFSEDLSRISFTGIVRDDSGRQDFLLKYSSKLRQYDGKAVWTETVSPALSVEGIASKDKVRKCFVALRHIHNDNIGQFYGIVTTKMTNHLLWDFGAHGSLRTLLDSDNKAVTHDLIISMIWDILEGMSYIQSSDLHFHGVLCSMTCMIDERFCLKLSGYGSTKLLYYLTKKTTGSNWDPLVLWFPPEMLRDPQNPGSKAADVFNVALIIVEMFTRNTPLDAILESESSRNHIIDNLLTMNFNLPRMPVTNEVPRMLHKILEDMMLENPKDRPSLKIFTTRFQRFFQKRGFIEKLLIRLEKYSKELEARVEMQTADLLDERAKVDALLREMIPQTFVDKLRNKETVETEAFELVTIFFSDLPEFGNVCALCTPFQIIALLNGVYSAFDVVLAEFDVYKVETVNDSYMVASGLPQRNGQRHAPEVAQMALRLVGIQLNSPLKDGNTLQLRIGIHSGPCVAGIVGLRMPRYCLFGDTINTASRMESHGAAAKIHLSPTTKHLLSAHGGFLIQSRGSIPIKGKGEMETFWLLGLKLSSM
ncbi:atrial natriuretic peptide receptor 1-like [Paramacrobiotus metropolitanus]|uniref:atrial natriuretic peptide receptor 1-like n=1 Tax=Paramacrobiotus metropolitanus TaxID=2943436 RepID=UPI0024465873|nr:atrial natriuretic peptide receptor 1-like [Paramacrobiotus metropolitanus]XP_055339560.1 atrial natriuretic peptide receptor 1-like [Paramacrobiotus metropolitanus]